MEGGRVEHTDLEFSKVINKIDDDEYTEPKTVSTLRKIMNDLKANILDFYTPTELDETPEKAQDMTLLDKAASEIKKWSHILKEILSETQGYYYTNYTSDFEKMLNVFHENKLDIDTIDDRTRDLCVYYVEHDLDVFTLTIKNPKLT